WARCAAPRRDPALFSSLLGRAFPPHEERHTHHAAAERKIIGKSRPHFERHAAEPNWASAGQAPSRLQTAAQSQHRALPIGCGEKGAPTPHPGAAGFDPRGRQYYGIARASPGGGAPTPATDEMRVGEGAALVAGIWFEQATSHREAGMKLAISPAPTPPLLQPKSPQRTPTAPTPQMRRSP
ncbi:hypothetical protein DQ04_09221040, partial [Trypanosoma grayi]|uniref:hypothetical protein n=1 Tax=Trypanosoma grayi TaxID=71804 RepID=UPI0004F4349E